MSTIESKTLVSADGTKLFAEAAGNPSKPVLVFIHGFCVTSAAFDPQFEDARLHENLYLVRYDMRGQGRSGMPREAAAYESIRHAEDFKAVCEGFGLRKPNVLAWSLGGTNVVDVIEAYGGEYIGNIIYCGGPLLTRMLHNEYIHPYLASLVPEILSTDAEVITGVVPKYVESVVEGVDKVLTYKEQLMFMGGYALVSPIVRINLITRSQKSERWEKDIRTKQVMLIQGTHDRHTRADALIEVANTYLGPFELHLLEGCGHSPALERPHEVNGYILSFMRRTSAQREA